VDGAGRARSATQLDAASPAASAGPPEAAGVATEPSRAQLLETALLNAIHYDTLIATKAARCCLAAAGRPVVDFGFRRAPRLQSGVRAARTAYLGGISATSNVEAGRRHGAFCRVRPGPFARHHAARGHLWHEPRPGHGL